MISPIEMNAVISRTQDIASLRHNEDNKAAIDHTHVQAQMDIKSNEEVYTVQGTNQSTGTGTDHDAKEKGKNEFFDIRRKDKKKEKDEVVRVKSASPGFDLKI
ncbi:MAG: hypothetical protein K6F34_07850 [Lachnospiraceae bacterium]|nr:hypothetical protein [Lachnospiraceae bacterium]